MQVTQKYQRINNKFLLCLTFPVLTFSTSLYLFSSLSISREWYNAFQKVNLIINFLKSKACFTYILLYVYEHLLQNLNSIFMYVVICNIFVSLNPFILSMFILFKNPTHCQPDPSSISYSLCYSFKMKHLLQVHMLIAWFSADGTVLGSSGYFLPVGGSRSLGKGFEDYAWSTLFISCPL